jgi:hypothetical protein
LISYLGPWSAPCGSTRSHRIELQQPWQAAVFVYGLTSFWSSKPSGLAPCPINSNETTKQALIFKACDASITRTASPDKAPFSFKRAGNALFLGTYINAETLKCQRFRVSAFPSFHSVRGEGRSQNWILSREIPRNAALSERQKSWYFRLSVFTAICYTETLKCQRFRILEGFEN